jgi:hypothetical protein
MVANLKSLSKSLVRRFDAWTRVTLNPVPIRHDR